MTEEGKNTFTIEYERGMIKEFEKRILAEGACKAFLPMGFVSAGEADTAHYDCSGYQPIANYEFKNSKNIVDLLEKCVFSLIDSASYLLNPKKLELNTGTVFYSDSRKEVKLAYVPKQTPSEKVTHAFKELLNHMESNVRGKESSGYLKATAAYIEYSNGSLFDVVNYLGELRQEIHACG
ncbi:MAG: DUF6382 domain-containing protein [Clostridiales bacterium]|nr:DUF6382 domain-containing protein [Clostridiales bacterium]